MKKQFLNAVLVLTMALGLSAPLSGCQSSGPKPGYRLSELEAEFALGPNSSSSIVNTLIYSYGGYLPTEITGDSAVTIDYDEEGRVVAYQDDYNSNSYTRVYSEEGKRVDEYRTETDMGNREEITHNVYIFDNKGNLTEERTGNPPNTDVTEFEYTYDDEGRVETCTIYINGVESETRVYSYNKDGTESGWIAEGDNNSQSKEYIMPSFTVGEYNSESDHVLSVEILDSIGLPVWREDYDLYFLGKAKMTYNKDGYISEISSGIDSSILPDGAPNISKIRFKYEPVE